MLGAGPGARAFLEPLLRPFAGIGAAAVIEDESTGADVSPLGQLGVPLMSLRQDMTKCFGWHPTEADTLDMVDTDELERNTVAMAFTAWALAEAPATLPRQPTN